jgi:hypothetical protein
VFRLLTAGIVSHLCHFHIIDNILMQQYYVTGERVAAASNPNRFSVFVFETNVFVSKYSGFGQFVRFTLKKVAL